MSNPNLIALLFVVMLSACARESNQDIVSVTIIGKVCPACSDGVTINRGGRIEELGPHGITASNPRFAEQTITYLPLDEFRHAFTISTLTGPATMVGVWVAYRDGSHEHAAIPIGKVSYNGISRMQNWTEFSAWQATLVVMHDRWYGLMHSFQRSAFSSIRLESRGCYGWCPVYSVAFASDGIATIRDRGPRCDETAKAGVPFREVLDAASLGGAGRLRPYYPVEAQDTFSASIILVTPKKIFVSEGPDRTSWGSEFLATQSRLDQIVRDAVWTPKIDLRRCAGGPLTNRPHVPTPNRALVPDQKTK
jgi:hypothetical protein